jgi:hypothetical protein
LSYASIAQAQPVSFVLVKNYRGKLNTTAAQGQG